MKKIIGIIICMLFLSCAFCSAGETKNKEISINNEEKIIHAIDIVPDAIPISTIDEEKIVHAINLIPDNKPIEFASLGDWYLVEEFVNPWPDGGGAKSDDKCIAEINLDTGEGNVNSWSYIHSSYASVFVGVPDDGSAYRWNSDSTNGRIILKDPSFAHMRADWWLGQGAKSSISITVKEYDPDGSYSNTWNDEVLVYTGSGKDYSLEGYYLDFSLQNQYLYTIKVFAYVEQYGSTVALIEPIKFKKIWWAYEESSSPDFTLIEPEKGLYFNNHKFAWKAAIPIFLFCTRINVRAEDSNLVVKSVRFECGDSSCTVNSDDGIFTGTLSPTNRGFRTLYADGYNQNGDEIASESIRIIWIPRPS